MSRLRRFYQGKKVLVTGHTGFKGAWMSEWLLALGAEVTGYSLEAESKEGAFELLGLASRMRHCIGDIRDRGAFSEILSADSYDCVFHLAAQSLVRESYKQPLQTCETNVMGTCHLLESARSFRQACAVVVVTTDKCYDNKEHLIGYSEGDPLGGRDVYSASKAAVELLTHAYRCSFFSDSPVRLATARAGNVIGGGDMAEDRIFPDAVRAGRSGQPLRLRNPASTRPWQHVLEPLNGYLWLGARLLEMKSGEQELCSAFNFGPAIDSNKSVQELVTEVCHYIPLQFTMDSVPSAFHEAKLLHLNNQKAKSLLDWSPVWSFEKAVEHTAKWYRDVGAGGSAAAITRQNIAEYESCARSAHLGWSLE